MTAVEAVASLAMSAALGVGVAQLVAVTSRSREAIERRSEALLAASNALELLRAGESRMLDPTAASLNGEVAGLPGAQLEITLGEATIGETPVREIVVKVTEGPDSPPLTLVGWQLADPPRTAETEASDGL